MVRLWGLLGLVSIEKLQEGIMTLEVHVAFIEMVMVCLTRRTQGKVMVVDKDHHDSYRMTSQCCLTLAQVINMIQVFYWIVTNT